MGIALATVDKPLFLSIFEITNFKYCFEAYIILVTEMLSPLCGISIFDVTVGFLDKGRMAVLMTLSVTHIMITFIIFVFFLIICIIYIS